MNTDAYKERLETEKAELEKTLQVHGEKEGGEWQGSSEGFAQNEVDPNVVADQIEELASNVAAVENLQKRLTDINAALERIAAGTYGTCEVGGEPIPDDRLQANPSARTCIEHA